MKQAIALWLVILLAASGCSAVNHESTRESAGAATSKTAAQSAVESSSADASSSTKQSASSAQSDAADKAEPVLPSEEPTAPTESHEQTQADGIPAWYTPGALSVTAVRGGSSVSGLMTGQSVAGAVKKLTDSASQSIQLPSGATVSAGGLTSADLIPLESSSLYPGGYGLYYNLKTGETVCFSASADKAARSKGTIPSGGRVNLLLTDEVSGGCFLAICDSDYIPQAYYYCNIYDGRWFAIPQIQTVSSFENFSPDGKYLCVPQSLSDGQVRLYLIDVTGTQPQAISIAQRKEIYSLWPLFSDTGSYIYYPMLDENDQFYRGSHQLWEIYGVEAQTHIRFWGTILRFVNDESQVVVDTPDGVKILDCATGADVTANVKDSLADWQRYRANIDDGIPELTTKPAVKPRASYSITLVPLFGDGTTRGVVSGADAVFVQDEYAYAYVDSSDTLTCMKMLTGERFTLPVDAAFVNEVGRIDRSRFIVNYYMYVSADKTRLTLCYVTDRLE